MKVGVWLDEYIDNQVGGGFSYVDRLMSLIDDYQFSKGIEVVYVTTKPLVNSYNKEVICISLNRSKQKKSFKKKLLKYIKERSYFINRFYKQSEEEIANKKDNIYYRNQLVENDIDVIYYLTQMQCVINDFPFISTNWDIGHLSMQAFPEVNNNRSFKSRQRWYEHSLRKSLSIFSESESGKKELISYLNLNPERIKILPMFPGGVIHQKISIEKQQTLLKSFELNKDKFFFYPAQFWAHKNHYNLLLAFKQFLLKEPDMKLVFTGSDKGNLSYIKSQISNLELTKNVVYLGFVNLESIYTLYKNTRALVMPTFLGPTNMPLLEAQVLDCPVLCSDLNGHREQLGEGAVYFDPLEYDDILNAFKRISDNDFRQKMLAISKDIRTRSKFNEQEAIKALEINLLEISKYRNCWDS
jgi:glycosyltransferase involved in cell wall biosynthesis